MLGRAYCNLGRHCRNVGSSQAYLVCGSFRSALYVWLEHRLRVCGSAEGSEIPRFVLYTVSKIDGTSCRFLIPLFDAENVPVCGYVYLID